MLGAALSTVVTIVSAGRLASFGLCGDHGDHAGAWLRRTFVVSVVLLLCPCSSLSCKMWITAVTFLWVLTLSAHPLTLLKVNL